jgi:hypothetical protein
LTYGDFTPRQVLNYVGDDAYNKYFEALEEECDLNERSVALFNQIMDKYGMRIGQKVNRHSEGGERLAKLVHGYWEVVVDAMN